MANEIEIVVRVRDNAAAGMAAVKDEVKAGGVAAAAEADKAGDQIGENLANGLTRDSSGRIRNALGRFASDAEKEAAGIGGGKGIKVPLGIDGDPFEHEFRAAMDEAERASQDADQTITRSFRDLEKASRDVRAAAGELGPALDGAGKAGGDAGRGMEELDRKTSGAGNAANSAGGSFLGMAGKTQMMAGAALVLGPALAAIPALAAGAAVGVGTLAGAFSGVIGALKDYSAQQANAAQAGASSAATAFANAVAIRNGEQAIADAKKSAAQAAVSSARQIADAQQSLVDAERQAGIAAQSSADAVAAAEQRLAQQHQSLAQAQAQLTLAERDGVNVLKDLNLAAEGAANSVVDAELAVQQATENNNKAKGNSLLTDLQKKQAAQALVDAQFQLKSAQQKATEAQVAANDANAKGVEGSTAVVAAKQGVASASQGVADAEQALARAQEAAGNQRIASDEAVGKAQQHLADSYSSAAQQQAASQQQVDRAVQALADTQRQQALAAASASAGTNKFAQDMAKLTQPGRDFVNQVLGMKSGLKQLSDTAQTATLPGFTQMLRDSQGMFPIVNQAIRDMGGVISGAAEGFGKLMKSPAFQGDMTKILKDAAGFSKQIADGLVGMLGGVADAAAKAGPIVKGLGGAFEGIMKTGIPAFLNGLTVNAQGTGQMFQALGDLVSGLLGPFGTLIGAVSGALGPAFRDLVPHVVHFVDAIVQSLLPNMPAFSQLLDNIARILGAILVIAEPLIPLFAQDLTIALKFLNPILGELAKLLEDNHGWLGQVGKVLFELTNPAQLAIQVLGWLEDHFGTLKDTVGHWVTDVKHWWDDAINWLVGKWHGLGGDAAKAWQAVYDVTIKPVTDTYNFITGPHGLGALGAFFSRLPGDFERAGAGLFSWIPKLFKDAVNLVILAWDSLKFSTPKIHIPGAPSWMDIDSMTFGVPQIHTLATGGIGSGLTGINEAGLEMVRLPTGSTVIPHGNTMSALAGGSGTGVLRLQWVDGPISSDFARAMFELFRQHIRVTAGNGPTSVQDALGQAF